MFSDKKERIKSRKKDGYVSMKKWRYEGQYFYAVERPFNCILFALAYMISSRKYRETYTF